MKRLRVSVLDPGHFHAALSLRESHPGLEDDVHVYAPEGPGLEAFRNMIGSFNARPGNPTRWRLHWHNETDPLAALVRERAGGLVILAGKNHSKMDAIERLNGAGYMIFADKPWVTGERAVPALVRALGSERPPTTDIMTSRFEPTSQVLRALMADPQVFGQPVAEGGEPALSLSSVHHLYKIVNGSVLRRPPWYFDVRVQGEGVVDVTTHLVDLSQWLLFPGQAIAWPGDVQLEGARCWATPVSLERFRKITGCDAFPESIRGDVSGDVLQYRCNGEIRYRLKGIPVRVDVLWNIEAPPGGGDTHLSVARGTRADLVVRQTPESGFRKEFIVRPKGDQDLAAAAAAALERSLPGMPGLTVRPHGGELFVEIPAQFQTTHEQHFCEARDSFLKSVSGNAEPAEHRANIVAKYSLLAAARETTGVR